MTQPRRRILIDASYACYWRHYAREKNPHARDAMQWIKDFLAGARPDVAHIVLDSATNWRREKCPEYKLHRAPRPHGVEGMLREIAKAGAVYADGHEADDVIASICAAHPNDHTIIVTNDKDMMQLVSDTCIVYDARLNETYDVEAVEAKYGVPPSRIRAMLAIAGDKSDGIDGVPGIGTGRAAQLLRGQGWPWIEAAIKERNADWLYPVLSTMLRELIIQFGERVLRNYEIVGLRNTPWVATNSRPKAAWEGER